MSAPKKLNAALGERLASEIERGVLSTFGNMFGLKPVMKPFLVGRQSAADGDISGIVALNQESTEGTMIVSFPKETIFRVLEKMYRKEFSEIDQSVKSGVGELTNIIYGVMKSNLNRDGFSFRMAVPSVIVGESHTVMTVGHTATMIVPFSTELGNFSVLVTFQPNENRQATDLEDEEPQRRAA